MNDLFCTQRHQITDFSGEVGIKGWRKGYKSHSYLNSSKALIGKGNMGWKILQLIGLNSKSLYYGIKRVSHSIKQISKRRKGRGQGTTFKKVTALEDMTKTGWHQ